jgi:predicted nuclease of predicted toxin-antitoxin system
MLRFTVDENFNMHIVNGVLRQLPNLDIRRVQDAGLQGADDPTVLEWAAKEGRVLLTHDVNTITAFANERIARGLPMPGVFVVSLKVPIGLAIEEILLIAVCSFEGEWEGQIKYLPLK